MDSFLYRSFFFSASSSYILLICAFYSSDRPGLFVVLGSYGLFKPASLAGLFIFDSSVAAFFLSAGVFFVLSLVLGFAFAATYG